jgi:predicted nucleic acid-binding protein
MIEKTIISDTSCLIALEKIGELNVLAQIFPVVIITKEVEGEFGKPLPQWIIVQKEKNQKRKLELQKIVDDGEASVIALALETKNCLLIIDEKKGRKLAQSLQLEIAGTLQILLLAKTKGIIPALEPLLFKLEQKGFRFLASLKEELLRKANEI